MTLDLMYNGYEECLEKKVIEVTEWYHTENGKLERERAEYIFKFPNDYGCIVEKHTYSKGYTLDRWELSPIIFDKNEDDYHFILSTLEEDDVLKQNNLHRTRGSLTNEQVCKYLEKYKNL